MSKCVSSIINAEAGTRLVFGLVNPDNDALYQLEYGFLPPNAQKTDNIIWQPVKQGGERIHLDSQNYPLVYETMASGFYRLRNMAGDDSLSAPVLIESYKVSNYTFVERV